MIGRMSMRAGSGVADSLEDEGMQVLGQRLDEAVRWVTLPDDLGGGTAQVVEHRQVDCPCGAGHRSHGAVLDRKHGEKRLMVTECGSRFLWTVAP